MEYKNTTLFGRVPAPQKFSEILDLTSGHANRRRNVYMWRGQEDISWPIHSAAYRRLSGVGGGSVSENLMVNYEKGLLKRAAHQGYTIENGRSLSDFEVLAKLQHHGAATRLVDFSRNILVALWFACKSEFAKDGLLLGIHTDTLGGYEGETEDRSYAEIFGDKVLTRIKNPQTWQPPVVSKRIAAQGAQFLYSLVSTETMGSLSFEKHQDAYIAIALTPEFKKKMLTLLEGTFDIRIMTLFPDLDGFCQSESVLFDRSSNYRW